VTANERRAEIMRILVARRHETMSRLAMELDVTDRVLKKAALTSRFSRLITPSKPCAGTAEA
jgi:hypothetical protein